LTSSQSTVVVSWSVLVVEVTRRDLTQLENLHLRNTVVKYSEKLLRNRGVHIDNLG
jgi:hypothetical protein